MSSRLTKILATLGPASWERDGLRALIEAGVDAVRLNFAFGSRTEHQAVIERVRQESEAMGRPVAVVQDLAGRKIRVGKLAGGRVDVATGATVFVTAGAATAARDFIPIDHPELLGHLKAGDPILLGDGDVALRVELAGDTTVGCRVVDGGTIRERQGIHFPETSLPGDSLTERDERDLRVGLDVRVDYVSLSFVRSAADVGRLKSLIRSAGADTPVIAKLETREAITNLGEIVGASDGLMVARGDLGLEMPLFEVPLLQKRIIRQANQAGKFVITATQMLESMIAHPRPTRAEVSDVANAVLDGTDAVMLSGETAIGADPAGVVRTMAGILERTDRDALAIGWEPSRAGPAEAMARAACELPGGTGAAAIVVFSRTGYSARVIASQRPSVPVIAFTPDADVMRRLALWRGIAAARTAWPETPDEMLRAAEQLLIEGGFCERGQTVILARWSSLRERDWTNFIHIHRLG